MLNIAGTVIGSDFDQERAEKMAPPLIAQLDPANCTLPRHNYFIIKYDVPPFVNAYVCIMFAYIRIYLYSVYKLLLN